MDELPTFDSNWDHELQVDEEVCVIDEGGYDIFEAIAHDLRPDEIYVKYPDWPDDAGWVARERVLERSRKNGAIFNEQERIRQQKDRETEEEDDDADDYKVPQKKKSKPKKPPPAKPRAVKEKKAPKPKAASEKKVKEPKPSKPKPAKPKEAKPKTKESKEERPQLKQKVRDEGSSSGEQSFGESDESTGDAAEPERPRFDIPERLWVPAREAGDLGDGVELRIRAAIAFNPAESDPGDMAIRFSDGAANCFIYRVEHEKFLILNGMRFRMKQSGPDKLENEVLYQAQRIRGDAMRQSESILLPKVRLTSAQIIVKLPECDQYLDWLAKEKRRKESVAFTDMQPGVTTASARDRKKGRKERELTERSIESSDSDD